MNEFLDIFCIAFFAILGISTSLALIFVPIYLCIHHEWSLVVLAILGFGLSFSLSLALFAYFFDRLDKDNDDDDSYWY